MSVATFAVSLFARTEQFRREMSSAAQQMENVGRRMQTVGRRMTVGVTLPLAAVGAAAVKASVDAEEAANKFRVVMGDSADEVTRRFESLQDTIPLTIDEMQKLSAGVQDLLVPLGLVRSEAAEMSADMVELAADLGSFNNVAADVPLEALKSALAGQSRPLRQFGIDVSQARLELLALEEGLISQGEELTAAARAQAIMVAAQRDSSDAIGDAARTADSAANQFRFLARDMRALAQTLGDILVPAVVPVVRGLRDIVSGLQNMSPEAQRAVVAVAGLAAAIGPLMLGLGSVIRLLPVMAAGFAALVSPAGLAVAAVASLGSTAYIVYNNWNEVVIQLNLLWGFMLTSAQATFGALFSLMERLPGRAGEMASDLRAQMDQDIEAGLAGVGRRVSALESEIASSFTSSSDAVADFKAALEEAGDIQVPVTEGYAEGFEDAVGHITEALALDIERKDLLKDAIRLSESLGEMAQDETRSLGDRNKAERERRGLLREINASMARQISAQMELAGAGQEFRNGLLELPAVATETTRSIYDMRDDVDEVAVAGEDAAIRWEQAFSTAISSIGASVGGVASQIANVAAAVATGGLAGGIMAGAGMLGSLVSGADREREQQRMQQEVRRTTDALRAFGESLRETTQFERIVAGAADRFMDALDAATRGTIEWTDQNRRVMEEWVRAIGQDPGIDTSELRRWFFNLTDDVIAASAAFRAFLEVAAQVEEQRQQDVEDLRRGLEVDLLRAQGLDDEADQIIQEVERQQQIAEAMALGGQALVNWVMEMHDAIDAAEQMASMEEELARARREEILNLDLAAREAMLWGSTLEQATAAAKAAAEAERARARDMREAGEISMETFRRWSDVIDGEFTAAIRAAEQAMMDAARAAREAAEAERFRQKQDLRSLQVQLLREQGRDAAARSLQNQIDLDRALNEGRSDQYVATLQLLQAERDRNAAIRESSRAVDTATRSMDRMASQLNAPQGFRLSLERWRAQTAPDPFAAVDQSSPSFSGRGSTSVDESTTIQGDVIVQMPAGATEQDYERILSWARKKKRAGGQNPFLLRGA